MFGMMSHLEKRLQQLELSLMTLEGSTLEERLRQAAEAARERQRLGLPAPTRPQGEGPIWERWRIAKARAEEARKART